MLVDTLLVLEISEFRLKNFQEIFDFFLRKYQKKKSKSAWIGILD
jgi:hypothetical protein